jgi:hypothetical protein
LADKSGNIPVIVGDVSYESVKTTAQKATLSGGVGLVEGALAQRFLGADKVLANAIKGDAVAVLEVLGAGLVLWKTGRVAREQLQDGAQKNDSWFQEILCTLAGFAGFASGMTLAKQETAGK